MFLVSEIIACEKVEKLPLLRPEYFSLAVKGQSETLFQPELSSRRSINMAKLLSFSSEQDFGPLTMLLLEGSSKTGLFTHLSKHVVWSL